MIRFFFLSEIKTHTKCSEHEAQPNDVMRYTHRTAMLSKLSKKTSPAISHLYWQSQCISPLTRWVWRKLWKCSAAKFKCYFLMNRKFIEFHCTPFYSSVLFTLLTWRDSNHRVLQKKIPLEFFSFNFFKKTNNVIFS